MSVYKGAFSPDDKMCSTAVGLDRDSYNPRPKRRNTLPRRSPELDKIDRDNSVGSGPVSDRSVNYTPNPGFDEAD